MRCFGMYALVAGLAAAGCAPAPVHAEAAGVLREDGATLSRIALSGKNVRTGDDGSGCAPGTRRGLYTITGDLAPGTEPSAVATALGTELHTMGYQEAGGPDARFGVTVSVLRKDSLDITFTVTLRGRSPNVEVAGTTGCLPA
ncbi:hypothetical protein [Sphaerisporangium album]|nr:hypothetical protein [Sphaerisporangium album]